jgi:DNA-directed RNA polymerase specialized sigma24 family protein
MRRILVDRARVFRSAKRGSGADRVELDDVLLVSNVASVDVLDLDVALTRLAQQDERKARLIELTYFGGMRAEEAATVLEISTATVNREAQNGQGLAPA